MKNIVGNQTFRIAFCAVIAALGTALMMLSSLIPVGTYAIPCFTGILSVAVVIEYGPKWALGVFVVTALLSFFLAGDKEAVLYLIAIFGYYPVLKSVLEKYVKNRIALILIKLLIFNAAAVASFYAGMFLLSIPNEDYTVFGVYLPVVFLLAGNVFFAVYDAAVTVFVKFYVQRIRKLLFKG